MASSKVNYRNGGKHWVLDNECPQHMTENCKIFTNIKEEEVKDEVTFEDNSKGRIK